MINGTRFEPSPPARVPAGNSASDARPTLPVRMVLASAQASQTLPGYTPAFPEQASERPAHRPALGLRVRPRSTHARRYANTLLGFIFLLILIGGLLLTAANEPAVPPYLVIRSDCRMTPGELSISAQAREDASAPVFSSICLPGLEGQ